MDAGEQRGCVATLGLVELRALAVAFGARLLAHLLRSIQALLRGIQRPRVSIEPFWVASQPVELHLCSVALLFDGGDHKPDALDVAAHVVQTPVLHAALNELTRTLLGVEASGVSVAYDSALFALTPARARYRKAASGERKTTTAQADSCRERTQDAAP